MDHPKQMRRPHRLKGYDYSSAASYLLTFNTLDRKRVLSEIVSMGDYDPPRIDLLPYGKITEKYIFQIESHYPGTVLENYAIMPDHVHLLLTIERPADSSKTSYSIVAKIIHALKSLTSKEIGESIWQLDFYDVIAETEAMFSKLDTYIDNNPAAWLDKNGQEPF